MTDFCTTLRERRKSVGLSQRKLAELANITPKTVRMIELGRIKNPHKYTMDVINAVIEETGLAKLRVLTERETKRDCKERMK